MSEYVKNQLATALRTLTWYVAIPAMLTLPFSIFVYFIGDRGSWAWNPVLLAGGIGLFAWCVRQSIRLLVTIRNA